ncbi:MAG TPA: triose-phosphate isomerase [Candidatus Aminicenantes bacterium]|nr:triose-phosphate isomerase [Candidatus Aminicenantes bacterium]
MLARKRRGPFVAGNWKMHLTLAEARELAREVAAAAPGLGGSGLVLVPPFTSLAAVGDAVAGSAVGLGAQDLYWEDKGAFTGEVSGPMLKDAGCAYVLVGHSERRRLFGETDETVNRKARAALRSGLSPVVCVGEVLEEREAGRTTARIDLQLAGGLAGLSGEDMGRVIIAYEPVWAIGTGKTASPAQAEEVHAHIRRRLEEAYGKGAAGCAIIYGGSVKPANSYSLFKEENIDGFLVGGASLEADGFVGIVREALRAYREET